MKILAVTQGASLRSILKMSEVVQDKIPHELALIVANSAEFMEVLHDQELFEHLDSIPLLKEWELFEASDGHDSSEKETSYWEDVIGEPLTRAIYADRYLLQGAYHKVSQNYCPRLSDERMIKAVAYGYKSIDEFFYLQSPDIVLLFGVTTYCEYIAQKVALKHGVSCYIFDSSHIGGNLQCVQSLSEWPQSTWAEFRKSTHLLNCGNLPLESIDRAQSYVSRVQEKGFSREYGDRAIEPQKYDWLNAVKGLYQGGVKAFVKGRDPIQSADQYVGGYFRTAIYQEIIRPWRSWRIAEYLKEIYLDPEKLTGGHRRIFYPLYYEPDASIETYGALYQNQIETIRSLALASPADCEILVKEHPKANGTRPVSYYKKLLQIPRVRLLPPQMPSNDAIALCNAVAVIAGVIGLEAAILGKPVLVFGKPPYRHMGKPHFHISKNPWKLCKVVEKVLDPQTSDEIRRIGEEVFVRLLSIVMKDSCFADLDYIFLQHNQSQPADMFGEKISRRKQQEALVAYLVEKLLPESETEDSGAEQVA